MWIASGLTTDRDADRGRIRDDQSPPGSGSGSNAVGEPAWYILFSMEVHVREANVADVEFARSLYFQTMRGMIESLFGWDQRLREESFASWFDLREAGIIVADGCDVGTARLLRSVDS